MLWVLLYAFHFARSGSPLGSSSITGGSSVRSAEDAILKRRYRLRFLGPFGVACLMIFGTALIMQPRGIEMAAYVPLLVASVYIGAGLWGGGSRYVTIGSALALLALLGYRLLPQSSCY